MKFIHTADWQIGKNFDRVTVVDDQSKLRAARVDAIRELGRVARQQNADFVLVAGDLFESSTPTNHVVAELLGAVRGIDLPVIAIPGNHDHGGPGGVWNLPFFVQRAAELAPNFRVLLKPEAVDLGSAWVLPCPLLRRHEADDLTRWIREPETIAQLTGDKPRIVLAHGSTQAFLQLESGDEEEGGWATNLIQLDLLPRSEVDYVALGDWHGTKAIQPWAWYSGTPEHDRFARGADYHSGNVLSVELHRGAAPQVEVIPTGRLGWHTLDFQFTGSESLDRLKRELEQRLGGRAKEDPLLLELSGMIGLETHRELYELRELLEARLLRVKWRDRTTVEPSEEEIARLGQRSDLPLTQLVLGRLFEESGGERSALAKAAIRELYGLIGRG
ncbi:MAG: DNA repair exonuclease [Blastopirellula sp.]|nr:DNA repair exonuclease [Blastopirellula sp.]